MFHGEYNDKFSQFDTSISRTRILKEYFVTILEHYKNPNLDLQEEDPSFTGEVIKKNHII